MISPSSATTRDISWRVVRLRIAVPDDDFGVLHRAACCADRSGGSIHPAVPLLALDDLAADPKNLYQPLPVANSPSSAFASFRSRVSKPSVNHP